MPGTERRWIKWVPRTLTECHKCIQGIAGNDISLTVGTNSGVTELTGTKAVKQSCTGGIFLLQKYSKILFSKPTDPRHCFQYFVDSGRDFTTER